MNNTYDNMKTNNGKKKMMRKKKKKKNKGKIRKRI